MSRAIADFSSSPIIIERNGTKITVESVGGRIAYGGMRSRFIPDIRGLEHFIKFEVPEEQDNQIKQAVETATVTVKKVELKQAVEQDEPIKAEGAK